MAETRTARRNRISELTGDVRARLPNREWIPAQGVVWASGLCRSSCAPQNESGMANLIAAVAGDQRDLGVFHLAVGRIGVSHLADALDDLQHAFAMRLRELAARCIAGQG